METRCAVRINKLTQTLRDGDLLRLKRTAAELLEIFEMTVRHDLNTTSPSVILG
ncbi:MAG: DeoR family transcriptional regulator [Symbiopectobacterium sp.]